MEAPYTYTMRKDPEWGEWVVKYYRHGEVLPEDTWSYCESKAEAQSTATAEVTFMTERYLLNMTEGEKREAGIAVIKEGEFVKAIPLR